MLQARFPTLQHTAKVLAASKGSELGQLIHALRHLPLERWSLFFKPQGQLLATYQLLEDHKDLFAGLLYELAQVDALRSVARLLTTAEAYSKENCYVFTNFIAAHDAPVMRQEAIWHPILDAHKAVGNDLILEGEAIKKSAGKAKQAAGETKKKRMMILTGPNAGGKSTYLQAMTLNLVLSQTLGIAAAKSNTQTLFHQVMTQIDIQQDLSEGLSLFDAHAYAMELMEGKLKECAPNEWVFCMLDEPMKGTREAIAAQAACDVVGRIYRENPNALIIVVTHLEELTKLPKQYKGCVNKTVDVKIEAGKIRYTYKIKSGKADLKITQDVATAILRKWGLLG